MLLISTNRSSETGSYYKPVVVLPTTTKAERNGSVIFIYKNITIFLTRIYM